MKPDKKVTVVPRKKLVVSQAEFDEITDAMAKKITDRLGAEKLVLFHGFPGLWPPVESTLVKLVKDVLEKGRFFQIEPYGLAGGK